MFAFRQLACFLGVFFQDGPVDSSIEIVPKLVKGAQTPGRQPGTARPGLGTRVKDDRLDGLAVEKFSTLSWQPLNEGCKMDHNSHSISGIT